MSFSRAQSYANEAQEKANALYKNRYNNALQYQDVLQQKEPRGSSWTVTIDCLSRPLLRFGFGFQLCTLLIGFSLYLYHGEMGVFTFDLFSIPETLRYNSSFSQSMVYLETLCLLGTLCLAGFQIYVSDNSKASRGFRAGSKMFSTAVILDIFAVALRLMQYFYATLFLGSRWWMKYTLSATEWCLFHSSGFAHAFSLMLYGLAIFYMECYHEEGTAELWGWLCLFLFLLASALELLLVFTHIGSFGTVIQLLSTSAAVVWAFQFEPLANIRAPELHDRDVNKGLIDDDDDGDGI